MVEREAIKYSTKAFWKDTPQLLMKGEVDLVIIPANGDSCIIEFADNLPKGLRESLEDLERTAQIISGQNPSIIRIYTKSISVTKVSDFLAEWLYKEGMELEEV